MRQPPLPWRENDMSMLYTPRGRSMRLPPSRGHSSHCNKCRAQLSATIEFLPLSTSSWCLHNALTRPDHNVLALCISQQRRRRTRRGCDRLTVLLSAVRADFSPTGGAEATGIRSSVARSLTAQPGTVQLRQATLHGAARARQFPPMGGFVLCK